MFVLDSLRTVTRNTNMNNQRDEWITLMIVGTTTVLAALFLFTSLTILPPIA